MTVYEGHFDVRPGSGRQRRRSSTAAPRRNVQGAQAGRREELDGMALLSTALGPKKRPSTKTKTRSQPAPKRMSFAEAEAELLVAMTRDQRDPKTVFGGRAAYGEETPLPPPIGIL